MVFKLILFLFIAVITALILNKTNKKLLKAFKFKEEHTCKKVSFENSKVKTTYIESEFDKEEKYLSWLAKNKEEYDNKGKDFETEE